MPRQTGHPIRYVVGIRPYGPATWKVPPAKIAGANGHTYVRSKRGQREPAYPGCVPEPICGSKPWPSSISVARRVTSSACAPMFGQHGAAPQKTATIAIRIHVCGDTAFLPPVGARHRSVGRRPCSERKRPGTNGGAFSRHMACLCGAQQERVLPARQR